jgi:spore coat polysaccharide biosynthesis protein SpsF
MSEMVRVSSRYVFCAEYYAPATVEVPFGGNNGMLFRRDYGGLFLDFFPFELALVREGRLRAKEGSDPMTWWLFERA